MNDVVSPEFDENGRVMRRIRSFVRRQGRLTKGQQFALDNFWPVMGVDFQPQPLDLVALFGREAPTVLEIGLVWARRWLPWRSSILRKLPRHRSAFARGGCMFGRSS